MIFVLVDKENSAIAALLMNFILKNKAKRGILMGRFAGKMVLNKLYPNLELIQQVPKYMSSYVP